MAKRIVIPPKPDIKSPVSMSTLGQFVRYRRTSFNMTIEEASSLCGVSKQALSNVEKGLVTVRMSTVLKIISALGISLWFNPEANKESTIEDRDNEWL